ncbi:GNAT family N-acetyltransferase [Tellurirhabdus bombi]|uniref:GNAT family N-acetyltransferase n=1 Tax=Tellurirhabdus bombi TaxID=2907205 RepID=UPI001F32DA71|nr:GNAT family N-acetyltransferase [Tellurirhabdus bombi]
MIFEVIQAGNLHLVRDFMDRLGEDGQRSFRYFQKRPVEVVLTHLLCAVGTREGQPVAYGHLDKEGETTWLGIAVAADARGQRLGQQMITYLLEEARRLEQKTIFLTVDRDNQAAIALYEKIGFVQIGQAESYFKYQFTLV